MRGLTLVAVALLLAGCTLPFPNGGGPRPYYEELLAGDPFTDLVVEIDHAPGRQPSTAAREHLVQELRNVTSKTRVSVKLEATLPDEGNKRWTAEELVALEKATRTTQHAAPVAVLHVLYPAGEYQNASVAGVTIGGTVMGPVVVFLDTIDKLQSPVGPITLPRQARDEIERATLLHEAGHAMGLVNNGLPMVRDHEDPSHPGHSRNPNSVMYWQVDSLAGIRQALLDDGTIPAYFDADDRADMRAAGGR
ncbi:MAG TPA: hypothetical protein VFH78_04325 [Candidatus Thermoplasmatota archaeon]|nr:hypothetical protein [Candidatus Thermoplasmatota archaeon]